MAKRGRDQPQRPQRASGRERKRVVWVYPEGEVTEADYLDLVNDHGRPLDPTKRFDLHIGSDNDRKPLSLVKAATAKLHSVEREAKKQKIHKLPKAQQDWLWPQVWVLFDRDDHPHIPTAFAQARKAGVHVAYSHPCFELWRLLHYQDYTSTFGCDCGSATDRLAGQPGFVATYGHGVRKLSEEQKKRVKLDQIKDGYREARKFAQKINTQHTSPDQNHWDPYTNVHDLIEHGLGLSGY